MQTLPQGEDLMALIPRMTEKGQRELRAHRAGMPIEERMVLVVIDGRSTVRQIFNKLPGFQRVAEVLGHLVANGYVEVVGIYDVRDRLREIAREVLGSPAGAIIRRIDEMKSLDREAVRQCLSQIRKIVRLTVDETKADALDFRLREEVKKVVDLEWST